MGGDWFVDEGDLRVPILAVLFGKGGRNRSCCERSSIPPFANNAKDGAPEGSLLKFEVLEGFVC